MREIEEIEKRAVKLISLLRAIRGLKLTGSIGTSSQRRTSVRNQVLT